MVWLLVVGAMVVVAMVAVLVVGSFVELAGDHDAVRRGDLLPPLTVRRVEARVEPAPSPHVTAA